MTADRMTPEDREVRSVLIHGVQATLRRDFYRSPNGDWVYRWADERLVLARDPDLPEVWDD